VTMRVVHELRVFMQRKHPATQDAQLVELRFLTLNPLGLEDAGKLVQLAESYNFALGLQRDQVQLVEGDPHAELHVAIEAECKAQLGLRDDDGAQVDHDDARLNDLERSVRNLGRAQNQLGEMMTGMSSTLAMIAAKVLGSQDRVVASAPEPAQYVPAGMPVQRFVSPEASTPLRGVVVPTPVPITPSLTPAQAGAQGMGLPLIGTPPPFSGDMSVPLNPRARGASRTPEMSSGMLQTHGPGATSQIISYSGKVNQQGEPIMDVHSLPTVGDSLRGPVSDIKAD
jgi:hypothetical protein